MYGRDGITNFIPVGSITTAEGYTNGNQATTSITTQSNIGVTKQFDPQTVAIGERSRLTITLYNPASSPITALSINDNFPAEVDVVTAATGDFVNTINAGEVSGSASGSPVSNTAPATDRLRSKAALEVQISIVGETAPNEATTCTGGTVNAAVSGTSIQLTGATIPANGACTVTADVLSNVSGSYIDDIPVGAISSTEGVTNAEETRAEIIIADPPTIDLSYTPPVIAPGGTSMAMITLGNPMEVVR